MDSVVALFCLIDDFCKEFEPAWAKRLITSGQRKRQRPASIALSELMTLITLFHQTRYRQFKMFYLIHVQTCLKSEFPHLPSYQRCVALMPRCAVALAALFESLKGQCSGVSFGDSTPLAVCDNLRIRYHRVFAGYAARGKSSTGWFFGFKLHLAINHRGELLNVKLTPGNIDDRKAMPDLCANLFGKLYADKGYIAKWLASFLRDKGIELITKLKKNMKPVLRSNFDLAMLRSRGLIETVIDELKNLCQIEHTRHRSVFNFCVNLLAGLVAYCLAPNKPRLPLTVPRQLATKPALIQN